ncbi:MAG: FMN-binding protein [Bacteroidetes bacterium]|nr:FMN-binding protein [Bacteroidota bacterium]
MEEAENTDNKPSAQESTGEKEPSSLRLILTLGIAGFLAGLIMVSTYLYTKPLIEANKAAAIEKAIFKVLPKCTSFKTLELKDGKLSEFDIKNKTAKGEAPKLVYQGFDSTKAMIGFAILGSEIGFADVITILMGYDANKKIIIGYEVLECKETPGLGDKIFKKADFLKNFTSLLTEPEIKFAKHGEKHNPNEVEAITGATISSKAVIRLLNKSMKEWKGPINDFINSNDNKPSEAKK